MRNQRVDTMTIAILVYIVLAFLVGVNSCTQSPKSENTPPNIEIHAPHSSFKDAKLTYEIEVKDEDSGIAKVEYSIKYVTTSGDTQLMHKNEFIPKANETAYVVKLLDSLVVDDYFSFIDIVVNADDEVGKSSIWVHRIYPFNRIIDLQHSHFNVVGPTYKIIDNSVDLESIWEKCDVDLILPSINFDNEIVLFYADHRNQACDCYLRVDSFSTGTEGVAVKMKTVVREGSSNCETWCEERFTPVLLLKIDKRYAERGISVAGFTEIICDDIIRQEEVEAMSL